VYLVTGKAVKRTASGTTVNKSKSSAGGGGLSKSQAAAKVKEEKDTGDSRTVAHNHLSLTVFGLYLRLYNNNNSFNTVTIIEYAVQENKHTE